VKFNSALAFSLALHGLLLWLFQPATVTLQRLQTSSANSLKASLQPLVTAVKPLVPPRQARTLAASPLPLESGKAAPAIFADNTDLPRTEAGVDANGLRQYRLGLAVSARRYKLYPSRARENGWSGAAEVRVAITANGVPQPPQLLRSSGQPLLDAAALEMIGNAARHTEVPASLRGLAYSVSLPVVFDLKNE